MRGAWAERAGAAGLAGGEETRCVWLVAAVLLALVLIGAVQGVPALWGPAAACCAALGAVPCGAGIYKGCVGCLFRIQTQTVEEG